jgi:hypothetical protein
MILTPGPLPTIVSVTQASVTLQAYPPTGGTAPITYQWYRSPQFNALPSAATLLADQTDLGIVDQNLQKNQPYYYTLLATDSTVPTPITVPYPTAVALTNGPSSAGYVYPQAPDFKYAFLDDFPFGPDPQTQFPDYRVAVALQMANTSFFNPTFFGTQSEFSTGYLLLAAHYLVMNIRRASQGMRGQFSFLQSSKSAGISVSVEIPERIRANPDYAWLCQTNYGAQYLHMCLPQLSGQMFTVESVTNP